MFTRIPVAQAQLCKETSIPKPRASARIASTVFPLIAIIAVTASDFTKLGLGNWSNVKGVGGGVYERVIDFGPGYRIYFGKDGDKVVILLAGGTKKRQDTDIINAKARWQDYKQRKKSEK
jgi:putative addiction module killer protein